ncbi:MAG: FG-GAP repeat protein [Marinicella pacifica]
MQLFRGSTVSGVSTNDRLYSQETLNGLLEADDGFGHSVAAGDINGDGIDDLVVGIWKEDIGTDTNAGAVQILMGVNGATGPSNTFGPIITQNNSQVIGTAAGGDRFGQNVLLYDLDNDGYDDLIVGSPRDNIIGSGPVVDSGGGVNILFSNGTDISLVNDLYFAANDIGDRYGYSITAGHFRDAHRPTDLVVGIPGLFSDDNDSDAGAVEVMEFEFFDVIFKDGLD